MRIYRLLAYFCTENPTELRRKSTVVGSRDYQLQLCKIIMNSLVEVATFLVDY
jgi:hypothetical protein